MTIDFDPTHKADLVVNVLSWAYQNQFQPGTFDVFCCPPCTEFSVALTTRPRNMVLADALVQKTLEKVAYLKPRRWYLENPRTGKLKDRPYMQGLPFVDVEYCQFGDWGTRNLQGYGATRQSAHWRT